MLGCASRPQVTCGPVGALRLKASLACPEHRRRPMKLRPLHDRLLVERVEEAETKKGGIIIPDSAKEKPQEGTVVAVGNGKRNEKGEIVPLEVKAGDRILFGKYSGNEVNVDDREYLILREDEVLAVLQSGDAKIEKRKSRLATEA